MDIPLNKSFLEMISSVRNNKNLRNLLNSISYIEDKKYYKINSRPSKPLVMLRCYQEDPQEVKKAVNIVLKNLKDTVEERNCCKYSSANYSPNLCPETFNKKRLSCEDELRKRIESPDKNVEARKRGKIADLSSSCADRTEGNQKLQELIEKIKCLTRFLRMRKSQQLEKEKLLCPNAENFSKRAVLKKSSEYEIRLREAENTVNNSMRRNLEHIITNERSRHEQKELTPDKRRDEVSDQIKENLQNMKKIEEESIISTIKNSGRYKNLELSITKRCSCRDNNDVILRNNINEDNDQIKGRTGKLAEAIEKTVLSTIKNSERYKNLELSITNKCTCHENSGVNSDRYIDEKDKSKKLAETTENILLSKIKHSERYKNLELNITNKCTCRENKKVIYDQIKERSKKLKDFLRDITLKQQCVCPEKNKNASDAKTRKTYSCSDISEKLSNMNSLSPSISSELIHKKKSDSNVSRKSSKRVSFSDELSQTETVSKHSVAIPENTPVPDSDTDVSSTPNGPTRSSSKTSEENDKKNSISNESRTRETMVSEETYTSVEKKNAIVNTECDNSDSLETDRTEQEDKDDEVNESVSCDEKFYDTSEEIIGQSEVPPSSFLIGEKAKEDNEKLSKINERPEDSYKESEPDQNNLDIKNKNEEISRKSKNFETINSDEPGLREESKIDRYEESVHETDEHVGNYHKETYTKAGDGLNDEARKTSTKVEASKDSEKKERNKKESSKENVETKYSKEHSGSEDSKSKTSKSRQNQQKNEVTPKEGKSKESEQKEVNKNEKNQKAVEQNSKEETKKYANKNNENSSFGDKSDSGKNESQKLEKQRSKSEPNLRTVSSQERNNTKFMLGSEVDQDKTYRNKSKDKISNDQMRDIQKNNLKKMESKSGDEKGNTEKAKRQSESVVPNKQAKSSQHETDRMKKESESEKGTNLTEKKSGTETEKRNSSTKGNDIKKTTSGEKRPKELVEKRHNEKRELKGTQSEDTVRKDRTEEKLSGTKGEINEKKGLEDRQILLKEKDDGKSEMKKDEQKLSISKKETSRRSSVEINRSKNIESEGKHEIQKMKESENKEGKNRDKTSKITGKGTIVENTSRKHENLKDSKEKLAKEVRSGKEKKELTGEEENLKVKEIISKDSPRSKDERGENDHHVIAHDTPDKTDDSKEGKSKKQEDVEKIKSTGKKTGVREEEKLQKNKLSTTNKQTSRYDVVDTNEFRKKESEEKNDYRKINEDKLKDETNKSRTKKETEVQPLQKTSEKHEKQKDGNEENSKKVMKADEEVKNSKDKKELDEEKQTIPQNSLRVNDKKEYAEMRTQDEPVENIGIKSEIGKPHDNSEGGKTTTTEKVKLEDNRIPTSKKQTSRNKLIDTKELRKNERGEKSDNQKIRVDKLKDETNRTRTRKDTVVQPLQKTSEKHENQKDGNEENSRQVMKADEEVKNSKNKKELDEEKQTIPQKILRENDEKEYANMKTQDEPDENIGIKSEIGKQLDDTKGGKTTTTEKVKLEENRIPTSKKQTSLNKLVDPNEFRKNERKDKSDNRKIKEDKLKDETNRSRTKKETVVQPIQKTSEKHANEKDGNKEDSKHQKELNEEKQHDSTLGEMIPQKSLSVNEEKEYTNIKAQDQPDETIGMKNEMGKQQDNTEGEKTTKTGKVKLEEDKISTSRKQTSPPGLVEELYEEDKARIAEHTTNETKRTRKVQENKDKGKSKETKFQGVGKMKSDEKRGLIPRKQTSGNILVGKKELNEDEQDNMKMRETISHDISNETNGLPNEKSKQQDNEDEGKLAERKSQRTGKIKSDDERLSVKTPGEKNESRKIEDEKNKKDEISEDKTRNRTKEEPMVQITESREIEKDDSRENSTEKEENNSERKKHDDVIAKITTRTGDEENSPIKEDEELQQIRSESQLQPSDRQQKDNSYKMNVKESTSISIKNKEGERKDEETTDEIIVSENESKALGSEEKAQDNLQENGIKDEGKEGDMKSEDEQNRYENEDGKVEKNDGSSTKETTRKDLKEREKADLSKEKQAESTELKMFASGDSKSEIYRKEGKNQDNVKVKKTKENKLKNITSSKDRNRGPLKQPKSVEDGKTKSKNLKEMRKQTDGKSDKKKLQRKTLFGASVKTSTKSSYVKKDGRHKFTDTTHDRSSGNVRKTKIIQAPYKNPEIADEELGPKFDPNLILEDIQEKIDIANEEISCEDLDSLFGLGYLLEGEKTQCSSEKLITPDEEENRDQNEQTKVQNAIESNVSNQIKHIKNKKTNDKSDIIVPINSSRKKNDGDHKKISRRKETGSFEKKHGLGYKTNKNENISQEKLSTSSRQHLEDSSFKETTKVEKEALNISSEYDEKIRNLKSTSDTSKKEGDKKEGSTDQISKTHGDKNVENMRHSESLLNKDNSNEKQLSVVDYPTNTIADATHQEVHKKKSAENIEKQSEIIDSTNNLGNNNELNDQKKYNTPQDTKKKNIENDDSSSIISASRIDSIKYSSDFSEENSEEKRKKFRIPFETNDSTSSSDGDWSERNEDSLLTQERTENNIRHNQQDEFVQTSHEMLRTTKEISEINENKNEKNMRQAKLVLDEKDSEKQKLLPTVTNQINENAIATDQEVHKKKTDGQNKTIGPLMKGSDEPPEKTIKENGASNEKRYKKPRYKEKTNSQYNGPTDLNTIESRKETASVDSRKDFSVSSSEYLEDKEKNFDFKFENNGNIKTPTTGVSKKNGKPMHEEKTKKGEDQKAKTLIQDINEESFETGEISDKILKTKKEKNVKTIRHSRTLFNRENSIGRQNKEHTKNYRDQKTESEKVLSSFEYTEILDKNKKHPQNDKKGSPSSPIEILSTAKENKKEKSDETNHENLHLIAEKIVDSLLKKSEEYIKRLTPSHQIRKNIIGHNGKFVAIQNKNQDIGIKKLKPVYSPSLTINAEKTNRKMGQIDKKSDNATKIKEEKKSETGKVDSRENKNSVSEKDENLKESTIKDSNTEKECNIQQNTRGLSEAQLFNSKLASKNRSQSITWKERGNLMRENDDDSEKHNRKVKLKISSAKPNPHRRNSSLQHIETVAVELVDDILKKSIEKILTSDYPKKNEPDQSKSEISSNLVTRETKEIEMLRTNISNDGSYTKTLERYKKIEEKGKYGGSSTQNYNFADEDIDIAKFAKYADILEDISLDKAMEMEEFLKKPSPVIRNRSTCRSYKNIRDDTSKYKIIEIEEAWSSSSLKTTNGFLRTLSHCCRKKEGTDSHDAPCKYMDVFKRQKNFENKRIFVPSTNKDTENRDEEVKTNILKKTLPIVDVRGETSGTYTFGGIKLKGVESTHNLCKCCEDLLVQQSNKSEITLENETRLELISRKEKKIPRLPCIPKENETLSNVRESKVTPGESNVSTKFFSACEIPLDRSACGCSTFGNITDATDKTSEEKSPKVCCSKAVESFIPHLRSQQDDPGEIVNKNAYVEKTFDEYRTTCRGRLMENFSEKRINLHRIMEGESSSESEEEQATMVQRFNRAVAVRRKCTSEKCVSFDACIDISKIRTKSLDIRNQYLADSAEENFCKCDTNSVYICSTSFPVEYSTSVTQNQNSDLEKNEYVEDFTKITRSSELSIDDHHDITQPSKNIGKDEYILFNFNEQILDMITEKKKNLLSYRSISNVNARCEKKSLMTVMRDRCETILPNIFNPPNNDFLSNAIFSMNISKTFIFNENCFNTLLNILTKSEQKILIFDENKVANRKSIEENQYITQYHNITHELNTENENNDCLQSYLNDRNHHKKNSKPKKCKVHKRKTDRRKFLFDHFEKQRALMLRRTRQYEKKIHSFSDDTKLVLEPSSGSEKNLDLRKSTSFYSGDFMRSTTTLEDCEENSVLKNVNITKSPFPRNESVAAVLPDPSEEIQSKLDENKSPYRRDLLLYHATTQDTKDPHPHVEKPKKKLTCKKATKKMFEWMKSLSINPKNVETPRRTANDTLYKAEVNLMKQRKVLRSKLRYPRTKTSTLYLHMKEYNRMLEESNKVSITNTIDPVLMEIPSSEIIDPDFEDEEEESSTEEEEEASEKGKNKLIVFSEDSIVLFERKKVYDRLQQYEKLFYTIYLDDKEDLDHVSIRSAESVERRVGCEDRPFFATYDLGLNDVRVHVTKDVFEERKREALFKNETFVECQNSQVKLSLMRGKRYLTDLDPAKAKIIEIDCTNQFSEIKICYKKSVHSKPCLCEHPNVCEAVQLESSELSSIDVEKEDKSMSTKELCLECRECLDEPETCENLEECEKKNICASKKRVTIRKEST